MYTGTDRGSESSSLRAVDLHVYFGGVYAVDGVSLELKPGEILGLIGPNGAGKTTLLNSMSGFQEVTGGKVFLDGDEITGRRPEELSRLGLARTFQGMRIFGELTAFENVELGALNNNLDSARTSRPMARKRVQALLERMSLAHVADQRAGSLPAGDERRVGFLRAIAMSPRFLLLDEPAAGLSEAESDALIRMIAETRDEFSPGILLIEHDMKVITSVCDRVQALDHGKSIFVGSPSEARNDAGVISAYLGTRAFKKES